MSLLQNAIDKIDTEMEKDRENPAICKISDYIISNLITNDENARLILNEKKTLKNCFSEVQSKAKKQASGGCAVIADEVVYGWVCEYYGIKKPDLQSNAVAESSNKPLSLLDLI